MINTYKSIYDDSGNKISGRTYLFINEVRDDGKILSSMSGYSIVPTTAGAMLVVDEWLIPQIDKLRLIDGELSVKDGETLDVPIKSDKELEIERLKRQIEELENSEPAQ